MLWMLFSCSWTLSFGTPHSQSPLDSSAANWFSSFFLLLATFAVDVSMCLSFTKCIHSVLLNHLVNLPRRRICNTQRLDNKMRYVKTCLHRTKWIEFHGWRWSDKEVNGMHYIRNFFLWIYIFNDISVFWPVQSGHNGTTLSCVRSAAMSLCIFGSAALLNNSWVVRADWRPNHQ